MQQLSLLSIGNQLGCKVKSIAHQSSKLEQIILFRIKCDIIFRSSLYCVFAFEEKLARGTLFSTKKCFGSKQATRVMHKEFNSLCTDIGQKRNSSIFGSQTCAA